MSCHDRSRTESPQSGQPSPGVCEDRPSRSRACPQWYLGLCGAGRLCGYRGQSTRPPHFRHQPQSLGPPRTTHRLDRLLKELTELTLIPMVTVSNLERTQIKISGGRRLVGGAQEGTEGVVSIGVSPLRRNSAALPASVSDGTLPRALMWVPPRGCRTDRPRGRHPLQPLGVGWPHVTQNPHSTCMATLWLVQGPQAEKGSCRQGSPERWARPLLVGLAAHYAA